MNQSDFTTERLLLRPRTLDDLDALCAMDAEPEVMRFIGDGTVPDPEAHRRVLVERIDHDFGDGLGIWAVVPKDEPRRFLGWVALHPLPGWAPDVEIGWRFARATWGRGYATEAARPLLDHGFGALDLPRIVAVIQDGNLASIRVAEKLGLAPVGRRFAWGADCLLYCRERPISAP